MKQYITDKQLLELESFFTNEEDYNEFWMCDLERYGIYTDNMLIGDISEQFTIGKMIEILDKNNVTDIGIAMNTYKNNISVWEDDKCICKINRDELCDSLWEAVKYTIKA